MRIVAVADLPWAHHPYKCAFADEFGATVPGDVAFEDRPGYFAIFAGALSPERLQTCRYHLANWQLAADAAIHVWEDDVPDVDAVVEGLLAAGESEHTVDAMCSFFWEPIFINGTLLGNGQHRVCAMKLAGVPRCLIED
jgi:hypothetical protein